MQQFNIDILYNNNAHNTRLQTAAHSLAIFTLNVINQFNPLTSTVGIWVQL